MPYYTWWWGYNTTGLPISWENYPETLNFPTDTAFAAQKTSGPAFPTNRFAAEFTSKVLIGTPGVYTFTSLSDDGSMIYVDNAMVTWNWGLMWWGPRYRTGSKTLVKGWHDVKVKYFENWGGAKLVIKYKGPDTNGAETILSGKH